MSELQPANWTSIGLDLNYFGGAQISGIAIHSPLGVGNFLVTLTWITDSTLDGLVCNDPCDDHAIQCLG